RLTVDGRLGRLLLPQQIPKVQTDNDRKKHIDQCENAHDIQALPPFASLLEVSLTEGLGRNVQNLLEIYADSSFLSVLRSTLISRGLSKPLTTASVTIQRLTSGELGIS